MQETAAPKATRDVRTAVPYGVLAVSLLLTLVGALYVSVSLQTRERLRFQAAVNRAEQRIDARLDTYVAMLRATNGLFAATDNVSRKQFATFTARLGLRENYPGIQGIGFTRRFDPNERTEFEQSIRTSAGFDDFVTWPRSQEDEHHAIVYLEPLDERNRRAIGFDMYSEPTRRAAMQKARDEGNAAASGPVQLVQEIPDRKDIQAGFLIYLPVYRGGTIPATLADRRRELVGFVYSPFRAGDLFGDVLRGELGDWLDVHIYDGTEPRPEHLLYDSDPSHEPAHVGQTESRQMVVTGRPWTIRFATTPRFHAGLSRHAPAAAALGGLAFSGGLFLLVRAQVRARLRAEWVSADLRRSQTALQRSEGKFRRLTDSNLIGVGFSRLSTGQVIDGNDAFFRIIGYTREEALAGKVRWDLATPAEYREADERAVRQLREGGACEPYEKEFVRPDGSRVSVMVGVALLVESPDETVGFALDLTQIKHAQRAMQDAKEAAEHANRLKDEFLATVSHELRTPLNAIVGWAQLLESGGCEQEDLRQGISTILRNARSQAQLIEDLLDVSRIVTGRLRLEARPVDLTAVVRAAIGSVELGAQAKGIDLIKELGTGAVTVWGDPDRLQQVVWNLLSNSIKFTPEGGTIRIVLADDDGQHARLAVSDTGIGITPEFLPYVFDRFRQADGSMTRKYGGLGLGLAIVRHIVELHGGTVAADSAGPGRGATFTVLLPLRSGSSSRPAGAPPAATAGAGSAAVPLRGVRVLVVDDDPDTRDVVRHVLAAQHATVLVAGSVRRAIELLRSHPVDVVVSDLAMPEEDGYDLIRMLRELPPQYGGRVPAVALSALVRPEDRQRALSAGYQAHLPKPIDAAALAATVADLHHGSQAVRPA